MNRKGDKSLIVGLDIGTSKVTALVGATLAMEMVCLYAYRHKLG